MRQLEAWIGPDRFKSGLRRYLKEFAYDCAASHHLWESLTDASEMPVSELIAQLGHPAGISPDHCPAKRGPPESAPAALYLPARRLGIRRGWCLCRSPPTQRTEAMKPCRFYCRGPGPTSTCLPALEPTTSTPATPAFTTSNTPMRRTSPVWQIGLKSGSCRPLDRWGLQNDLFALVKAGELTMDAFLDWADHYRGEQAYLPLSKPGQATSSKPIWCCKGTSGTESGRTAMALMDAALDAIGFEPAADESQTTAMLRDQLLVRGSLIGNDNVLAFLTDRFHAFAKGDPVPPDIFRSVMTAGAVAGGQDALDTMVRRLASSTVEHERTTLATALGACSRWTELAAALDEALDKLPEPHPFHAAGGRRRQSCGYASSFGRGSKTIFPRLEKMHPLLFERVVAAFVPGPGLTEPPRTRAFCEQLARQHPRLKDVVDLSLERLEVNHRFRLREQ